MNKGTNRLRQAVRLATLVATTVVLAANVGFADDPIEDANLAELSLEELMNIEVYSVSKRGQSLHDSAAATTTRDTPGQ